MDYEKSIRKMSLLGQRGTFGMTLTDIAQSNDKIVVLSNDLTRTSGLERFEMEFPDRLYNVGIAEQNSIGMAAGLADSGYIPFVTTFANFATLRANEFVRHFMAYMNCNVKLVGLSSGFAMELFGNTHYGLEDISTIRSMPNIIILSPADGLETAKCVKFAAETDKPVYIRLSGKMNNPIVYKKDYEFRCGEAIRIKDGSGIVLYATGSMVYLAMKVADSLEQKGISSSVYDFHTIKPIDTNVIIKNKDAPLIVTIEEHAAIGGLGSAIAEALSIHRDHGRLIRFGTKDVYLSAGTYEYMLSVHGLTVDNIVQTIIEKLKEEIR